MKKEELLKVWERFADKNDFRTNPDRDFVGKIAEGVLMREQSAGLKLCPCRVSDGKKETNLQLLCPCNFKNQPTWKEEGRCWCGLFVRR